MATSKVLQIPQIVSIIGSTIRVAHPDISKNPRTTLAVPISAGATAMTVLDNNGFANDDWFIVGVIGDNETEECDVNGAVTRGTSLTVTNTLKFDHELDAGVNKIYERAIKIYGASTDGGAGTLIASINAITTPIADAVMIQWNNKETEYTLISTDTAYAYYYATFTDGVTDSDPSEYVQNSGLNSSSVEYMIQQALDLTDSEIDPHNITRDRLVKWANDAQMAITQYKYQDPQSGVLIQMDWDFEVDEDITSIALAQSQTVYPLSLLAVPAKYNTERSIIDLKIGVKYPLRKMTIQEFDQWIFNKPSTRLNGQALAGATSITVDSNIEFVDNGTLYIGSQIITYTGRSGTTLFTGIPASGDGAITSTLADDSMVWQGVQPAQPLRYCIFRGNILLDIPPSSEYDGYPLKVKYFKKIPALTAPSDVTPVSFTNVFQYYIGSKIEWRRSNLDRSQLLMSEFEKQVLNNALTVAVPTTDPQRYYNFGDDYDNTIHQSAWRSEY